MSHISTAVEYALHTLLYIIDLPDDAAAPSSKDLATLRALPVKFMAGVTTKLNKAGIVVATEGMRGGIRLARSAEDAAFHLPVRFKVRLRRYCKNVLSNSVSSRVCTP
ncbi:Rrf2 family transcriptional regulator [Sphingomonas sp. Leaf208]|uniref:RrF2 family transcriptional regulator n=1 Tax=Sphingomonas sp. Leaf208 TaxID=1735679 RepID=UPI0009EB7DBF